MGSHREAMFHLRIMLTALRGLRQNLVRSILATLGVIKRVCQRLNFVPGAFGLRLPHTTVVRTGA